MKKMHSSGHDDCDRISFMTIHKPVFPRVALLILFLNLFEAQTAFGFFPLTSLQVCELHND